MNDDQAPQHKFYIAEETTPPPHLPEPAPHPASQQVNIPIAIALPSATRRVREQVMPAWYGLYFTSHRSDPAVSDLMMTMLAALSTADQAMMTQDVGQMIFIWRVLEGFQAPQTSEPVQGP